MKTTKLIKVGYEFSKLIDQWENIPFVVVKVLINELIGIQGYLIELTRKTLPRNFNRVLFPFVDADDDKVKKLFDLLVSTEVSGCQRQLLMNLIISVKG